MSGSNAPTLAADGGGNPQTRHDPVQPPRDTSHGATNVDNNDNGLDRCGHCGTLATAQTLLLCTGCRQRAYCGRSCQLLAWRAGHKKVCKLLKADAEMKKIAASISAAEDETVEADPGDPPNKNPDPPDAPSAEASNGPAGGEPSRAVGGGAAFGQVNGSSQQQEAPSSPALLMGRLADDNVTMRSELDDDTMDTTRDDSTTLSTQVGGIPRPRRHTLARAHTQTHTHLHTSNKSCARPIRTHARVHTDTL